MNNAIQSFLSSVAKASPLETFCILITFAIASGIVDLFVDALLLPRIFSVVFYSIAVVLILGWTLTIATALELLLVGNLKRYQFKLCLTVGLFLIFALLYTKVSNQHDIGGSIGWIIFPCYVFGSTFFISGFVALNLNHLELRNSIAGNVIRDTFLIFLWPVGVWSIQNRVNKVANQKTRIPQ